MILHSMPYCYPESDNYPGTDEREQILKMPLTSHKYYQLVLHLSTFCLAKHYPGYKEAMCSNNSASHYPYNASHF